MQLQLEVKPAHVVVPKGRGGAGPISSCDMIDRSDGTASRFPVSLLSWVGIQWRADDLLFDFETCPNYQKLP